jgi:ribosomal protein L37E
MIFILTGAAVKEMRNIKVKEIDRTGKEIYCRRCGRAHAILKFDGQVLLVGNIEIYNSVRYACAACHYPVTFIAPPIKDERKSLGKNSRDVLINLGKTKNLRGDE